MKQAATPRPTWPCWFMQDKHKYLSKGVAIAVKFAGHKNVKKSCEEFSYMIEYKDDKSGFMEIKNACQRISDIRL